jgi:hypothetical protein
MPRALWRLNYMLQMTQNTWYVLDSEYLVKWIIKMNKQESHAIIEIKSREKSGTWFGGVGRNSVKNGFHLNQQFPIVYNPYGTNIASPVSLRTPRTEDRHQHILPEI